MPGNDGRPPGPGAPVGNPRERDVRPAGSPAAGRAGDPAEGVSYSRTTGEASMAKTRKSWREKLLDDKGLPKVGRVEGRMVRRWGTGTMVIPAPVEVDALMKRVPRGRLATIDTLRSSLAATHRVTLACPLTTGIFAWIEAHAADEAERQGRRPVAPYWRLRKNSGELNPRYPGGVANLRARLAAEGHRVVQRGQRHFVADYERALARLAPRRPARARGAKPGRASA